jgi:HSP20 family protein
MSALIRYARPAALTSWIDDLFNDSVFSLLDRDISTTSWPRVDIAEDKNAYHIKADLPGLEKDELKVSVENGVLTIGGEKKEEKKEHEKGRFYHYERSYGKFCRSFNLPEDAEDGSIEATYKNGVLQLTLKKSEKAQPKAIEVKVK